MNSFENDPAFAFYLELKEKQTEILELLEELMNRGIRVRKWQRKDEVQRELGLGNTKLWELEKENLLVPRRPFGGNSKLYYLTSEVDRLIMDGEDE